MKIIYVHGLDSTANSVKGQLLEQYCVRHHPETEVIRPDLNLPPDQVFSLLTHKVSEGENVLIIGSSLGGYFSSLVSNATGCPALLLNPSTQPHISLQRFLADQAQDIAKDSVVYTTTGGWQVTPAHLDWFAEHRLSEVKYPSRMFALIKAGDELLDPQIAADFYRAQGAEVVVQEGGDHRMTDFESQLPMIMKKAKALIDLS